MAIPAEKLKLVEEQQRRIKENLAAIKHRIVIFSGKGGVGKTTIAVNLAYALAKRGSRVGLLDGDITGPNVPKMIGLTERPWVAEDERMIPPEKDGVKVISLAMIIPPDSPVIWRGPLRSRALDQFLGDVMWGELDYLVADLAPGTGDEILTMAQRMEPEVAVIVTTPQEMSLIDSRRAINMAKTMEIPKIGVVENMAGLRCPQCGYLIELFGSGGGERAARKLQVRFMGRVPMNLKARQGADEGKPIILEDEKADISQALFEMVEAVVKLIEEDENNLVDKWKQKEVVV
ncbi:MAG: Mrp/NBP35 family ATP-binding protein [Acidobacteria bacterium]|nr:Mrp/NBP35 family ATP-binding protein [Acidobacteriota bacterium]